ncbi:MAG: SLOG family protein [Eubacteriales bacterium]|nr:SLOG family protein [Eubacteriales bacterium]
MFDKLSVCCFTGHRRIEPAHRSLLPLVLRAQIGALVAENITTFATGGAKGFDTLAAEAVLEEKAKNPDIRLVVVAPCADQSSRWSCADATRYEHIRRHSDAFICLFDRYTPRCMQLRNRTLVDMSSVCVAYCLREKSGTSYTLRYAEQRCLTVVNLAETLKG